MYGRVRPWDGLIGILRSSVRLPPILQFLKKKKKINFFDYNKLLEHNK